MNTQQLAEAFSRHRFSEVYGSLHEAVRWVIPGQEAIEGKAAVVSACEESLVGMDALERVEFTRFVSVGGPQVAAVDVIAHYVGTDGNVSIVSSADIYEFDADGLIDRITSYAVELPDAG